MEWIVLGVVLAVCAIIYRQSFGTAISKEEDFRYMQSNAAEKDIKLFINGLKGMDSAEISLVVACAAIQRNGLEAMGFQLDRALGLGFPLTDDEMQNTQKMVGDLTRKMQSQGRNDNAAALMPWLHSLRCYNFPEIRIYGREMWGELSRGFEGAESFYKGFEEAESTYNGLPPLSSFIEHNKNEIVFNFIPFGLSPERH
jgi:hypothetical protein